MKLSFKNIALFVSGIFITLSIGVWAFTIETSVANLVQYIKQIVITSNGWYTGDVYVDLNHNGTWEVYIKDRLAIWMSWSTANLAVSWIVSIWTNTVISDTSAIVVWKDNTVVWLYSVSLGWEGNSIYSDYSVIVGWYENEVFAEYGVAMWYRASVNNTGTFVWADSQSGYFESMQENTFLVRAENWVGINTNDPKEALHISGAIVLWNSENTTSVAGTIKFSWSNFYGYDGTGWLVFGTWM